VTALDRCAVSRCRKGKTATECAPACSVQTSVEKFAACWVRTMTTAMNALAATCVVVCVCWVFHVSCVSLSISNFPESLPQ
jgi:hypothetical protein